MLPCWSFLSWTSIFVFSRKKHFSLLSSGSSGWSCWIYSRPQTGSDRRAWVIPLLLPQGVPFGRLLGNWWLDSLGMCGSPVWILDFTGLLHSNNQGFKSSFYQSIDQSINQSTSIYWVAAWMQGTVLEWKGVLATVLVLDIYNLMQENNEYNLYYINEYMYKYTII